MELNWCAERGIKHSEFLEWGEDRAKVIALLMEKADRCDMCGTAPWEWDENKYAYEAVERFCTGCYQKQVFSQQENSSLPGTNVELVPVTAMRKAERQLAEERRRKLLKGE